MHASVNNPRVVDASADNETSPVVILRNDLELLRSRVRVRTERYLLEIPRLFKRRSEFVVLRLLLLLWLLLRC